MRSTSCFLVIAALSTLTSMGFAQTFPVPDRKLPTQVVPMKPANARVPFNAAAYDRLLAGNHPVKDRVARHDAAAQAVAARVHGAKEIADKVGLDMAAYQAAIKAMTSEKDATKRAALHATIERQFGAKLQAARQLTGLKPPAPGTKLRLDAKPSKLALGSAADLILVDRGTVTATPGGLIQQAIEGDPSRQDAAPPAPPPAAVTKTFTAPFTDVWTKTTGDSGDTAGSTRSGDVRLAMGAAIADSHQGVAGINQTLWVPPGTRRIHVNASLHGRYDVAAAGGLAYASAEALLNLRVLDGSNVLCSDRVSLARAMAIVFGDAEDQGTFSKQLACEVTRSNPADPGELTIEVDAEGWVGVGGFGGARATIWGAAPVLQEINVNFMQQ